MKKEKINEKLFHFIENSPTAFHTVKNCEDILKEQGYVQLKENQEWEIKPSGKYYVTRNDSSLIAFSVPEGEFKGFHIAAAHSDSPCFKLKECPDIEVEKTYTKLNVEPYGGVVYSSWLDRPLAVAGRIITKDGSILVNMDKESLIIPNVAIHLNREINKGFSYNPQTDMLPLMGLTSGKKTYLSHVAKECNVSEEEIYGHDLFVYVRQKPVYGGVNREFILAPRLDDLQCVFGIVNSMAETVSKKYINVCAVFDNEEVGSNTKQGAGSTFLEDVLMRMAECFYLGKGAMMQKLDESFMISADNAHALHPNHPEKADPTNRPGLNGGIVLKYNAAQKYTTDGVSAAMVKRLCEEAKVPVQTYANRSDEPGGATLGNIAISHVSIKCADIGMPQLSMHCSVETTGSEDTVYLVRFMNRFYEQ